MKFDKNMKITPKNACLIIFGFFLTIIILGLLIGLLMPTSEEPKIKKVDKIIDYSDMAFIQSKNFVKDRLKAPSTANFPTLDYVTIKKPDHVYIVKSYVQSQNSFGVMIKNTWSCKVKYLGGVVADQNSWKLIEIEISP